MLANKFLRDGVVLAMKSFCEVLSFLTLLGREGAEWREAFGGGASLHEVSGGVKKLGIQNLCELSTLSSKGSMGTASLKGTKGTIPSTRQSTSRFFFVWWGPKMDQEL